MGKTSLLAKSGSGIKLIACALLILCLFSGLANTCEHETSSEEPDQPAVIVENITQLTSSHLSQSQPVWSPDGTKILYQAGGYETIYPADIWVMNADGSNKKQLTDDPTVQCNPCWSPDGTKIVYESDGSDNREIWVMNADGSNQTQLTTSSGRAMDASWSPDGTKVVYVMSSGSYETYNEDLWIMNADGTGKTQLATGVACPYGGVFNYSISPQGTIAYGQHIGEGSSDIWTMDLDGSSKTQLTFGEANEIEPLFSPDGDEIAFTKESVEHLEIEIELWVMDSDGSNKTKVVDEIMPFVWCWSPDGTKIAYELSPQPYQTYQIHVVNEGGSGKTQVTGEIKPEWQHDYEVEDGKIIMLTEAAWNYDPSWSPDGTRIAYTSAKSIDIPSEANIWVMTLGGVTPTPPITFTNEDIEWLAITIALEAGSVFDNDKGEWEECSHSERMAVGWTILNRFHGLWEGHTYSTIKEVVTASGQYATGGYVPQGSEKNATEALNDIPEDRRPTSEILQLAIALAEGQIPDPTGGATHFFSPIGMPREGEEYECSSPIGNGVMDCNGGLHEVPGISKRVYFPSWANDGTLVWVGDLDDVRRAYFMLYRITNSSDEAQTTPAPDIGEDEPTEPDGDLVKSGVPIEVEVYVHSDGRTTRFAITFFDEMTVSEKIVFKESVTVPTTEGGLPGYTLPEIAWEPYMDGYIFVSIPYNIKNLGPREGYIDIGNNELKLDTGYYRDARINMFDVQNRELLLCDKLEPGEEKNYEVIFEIPQGAIPLEWRGAILNNFYYGPVLEFCLELSH